MKTRLHCARSPVSRNPEVAQGRDRKRSIGSTDPIEKEIESELHDAFAVSHTRITGRDFAEIKREAPKTWGSIDDTARQEFPQALPEHH